MSNLLKLPFPLLDLDILIELYVFGILQRNLSLENDLLLTITSNYSTLYQLKLIPDLIEKYLLLSHGVGYGGEEKKRRQKKQQ